MASLEKVSKQYRGKMASGYDEKRLKQRRWHEEQRIVEEMLVEANTKYVLDMPVGTGRFISVYRKLKLVGGVGLDSSEEMVALARKKNKGNVIELVVGNGAKLTYDKPIFDTCVCVRFFNLVEPTALATVMAELSRVTTKNLICTIRLGDEYFSNSAMATHDEKQWMQLLKKHRWKIVRDEHEMFVKGWHLFHLVRV